MLALDRETGPTSGMNREENAKLANNHNARFATQTDELFSYEGLDRNPADLSFSINAFTRIVGETAHWLKCLH